MLCKMKIWSCCDCAERYSSDSLARRQQTPDGLLHEGDEDDYREQLRQIQRSISPAAEPLPQVSELSGK